MTRDRAVKSKWALDDSLSFFLVCCRWNVRRRVRGAVQHDVDDAREWWRAVKGEWCVVDVLMKWCDEWTRHVDIESAQDKIVAQELVVVKVQLVKMDEQRSSCGCVNCCCSLGSRHSNPKNFELLNCDQQLSTNSTNSAPSYSSSAHQTANSTKKLRSSMKSLTSWQMRVDAATSPEPPVVCHCPCAAGSPQQFSTMHLFFQKVHWTTSTSRL